MTEALRPLPPPPEALRPLSGGGTFEAIVRRAGDDLRGQGWDVVDRRFGVDDPWHLVGRRGQRLRVVQVIPPAARMGLLDARRDVLGAAARLAADQGTMEQWLAHVRPDSHVAFGPYVLNPQLPRGSESRDSVWRRLGLDRPDHRRSP